LGKGIKRGATMWWEGIFALVCFLLFMESAVWCFGYHMLAGKEKKMQDDTF